MAPPLTSTATDQRTRNRVLLVTYPFPPVGGAGVQRVTKFVKYLPRHGWDVSVLTVANPSVPLFDDSLAKDIPPDTIITRARSWEPGYALKASVSAGQQGETRARGGVKTFLIGTARRLATLVLQPDPQILWLPGAVADGKRLLRRVRHDAIFASGPPFSTFLLGAALRREAKVPLVLDYRDEWTISNEYWENKRLDPVSRFVQDRMQRKVLRAAQGLIATTRCSAESLATLSRRAGGRARTTWVYNGFDPDDFDVPPARAERELFRLTYTGTLWNLTSVGPLIEAVKRVAATAPDLVGGLELVFAGRRTGPQSELLAGLRGLPCRLVEHPYLDHSAAVELMRGSEALCLLLSELPGAGRVVPAKLFEYMATRRPILTVAPAGEARDLLRGYPGGQFAPGDIEGIAAWLSGAIRDHRASAFSSITESTGSWDSSPFTRANEAGQLADFMNGLLMNR
ncbi:glycosyltransferase [Gemmata massiliana]|uniref:glycosyltransferase n=1 Tax=Gemmata massiliana TaxID=1210884 RepID=UPI001E4EBE87|nr:glycosyltransferase [Gemmata massiliana]